MTHVPHELAEDFPDHNDAIHEMAREIHRSKMGVIPATDDFENRLHRQHLAHNDELSTKI
jgi:uncharacterized protein